MLVVQNMVYNIIICKKLYIFGCCGLFHYLCDNIRNLLFMIKYVRDVFLAVGLLLLIVALIFKSILPDYVFTFLFITALSLKGLFLAFTFRVKGFSFSRGIKIILVGVIMILFATYIRTTAQVVIYNLLFYLAVTIKIIGLCVLVLDRKNKNRSNKKSEL